MTYRFLFILLSLGIVFASCNSSVPKTTEDFEVDNFEVPESIFEEPEIAMDDEAMDEIIQNISSPVEMSALLKDEGIAFNYKLLSPTDNVDEFNTSFKQALNLGVLGADMGYLNIYSKTGAVLNYISAISELSNELNVGQFFNFSTLKRLATNSENIDSLMYISVSSFDKMDAHLAENSRSDISALLVTGVWIEGIYLATQVVKENNNKLIRDRVAEQRIVLEQLLMVLSRYNKNENFFELNSQLEKINTALQKVKITEIEGDAEMMEVDGILMAVSNTTTTVEMSDEQLNEIIAVVENVRNGIIQY